MNIDWKMFASSGAIDLRYSREDHFPGKRPNLRYRFGGR